MKKDDKQYYASSRNEWRKWLKENGGKESIVWLNLHKKDSDVPSVTYIEAVEEALCFGWIDSTTNSKDEKSYLQSFTRRKPRGNWSKINKERVARLIREKRMTKKGLDAIEMAKKNGAWTAMDHIEELVIPKDLKQAFAKNKTALNYFEAFPPSAKKVILAWISNAKTETTRNKRIGETVRLAEENIRANQYQPKP